jgi:hypothetical protein
MQIKSQAPRLNVVVKLHKETTTIRPTVNYNLPHHQGYNQMVKAEH